MKEVKFNYTKDITKPHVICDTNVWYNIAQGKYNRPEEVLLIPTSFSLFELATSETMSHSIKLYQDVLKAVYENCGPIIPINPFDFIIHNHDSSYPINHSITEKVLTDFTKILKRNIPDDAKLDEKTKRKIIEDCQKSRGSAIEFADFGTDKLAGIRKNINKGVGQKEHLKKDPTEINKEMVKTFLNEHVKDKGYIIDFETFDWSRIELFMVVTEIFFKKLETTKGMKVHPNDAVDWFNMLYVTPEDQYLTFETSWRNYIESDNRIKHYLYH